MLEHEVTIAGAALLLGLAGCGEIIGADDYRIRAREPDAAQQAGASVAFADQACGACVNEHCPAELAACDENPLCSGWERCTAACPPGDGACEHTCFMNAGASSREMGEIAMCTAQHCDTECQAAGALSAYGPECGQAVRANCGEQYRACAEDEACAEWAKCLYETNCLPFSAERDPPEEGAPAAPATLTPRSMWECTDRTQFYEPRSAGGDAGALQPSPSAAYSACLFYQTAVYSACALGDLSCTGRYDWPTTTDTKIDVTVFVNSAYYPELPNVPLVHVPVRVCRRSDEACVPDTGAENTAETDSSGRATFRLNTDLGGVPWYFEVTPGWPTGPSYLLFNSVRPLSGDTFLALATNQSEMSRVKDPAAVPAFFSPWSEQHGALHVFFRSCENNLAKGLELRVDGDPAALSIGYGDGAPVPNPSPTEATVVATAVGVEPGVRVVSSWKDGTPIGEVEVVVRADSVTFLNWFGPNAR